MDARQVMHETMVQSALLSPQRAEELGWPRQDRHLGQGVRCRTWWPATPRSRIRCNYALHLGLTEAGMGSKGIVASSAALGILLQEGIGDTIRILADAGTGRRPHARKCSGAGAVADHGYPLVRADGRRLPRLRAHHIDRVPGTRAGRPGMIRERMPDWKARYPGVEELNLRGHGLHRQRPGRDQACRYRHFAARHRRKPRRPRVHRRQEGDALREEGGNRSQYLRASGLSSSAATSSSGSVSLETASSASHAPFALARSIAAKPGGVISPLAMSSATWRLFTSDHALRGCRGDNRSIVLSPSSLRGRLSIQPKQRT
jgi:hypothetical protein